MVIPPFAVYTEDFSQGAVLAGTHTFSPSLLNEARLGYTRVRFIDTVHLENRPDVKVRFS